MTWLTEKPTHNRRLFLPIPGCQKRFLLLWRLHLIVADRTVQVSSPAPCSRARVILWFAKSPSALHFQRATLKTSPAIAARPRQTFGNRLPLQSVFRLLLRADR